MDTAIRIDNFPAGVHQLTQHARLTLAGHTFPGHARPRLIDTPQPYLELSREVPAGLPPKCSGVLGPSPFALLRVAYAVGERS